MDWSACGLFLSLAAGLVEIKIAAVDGQAALARTPQISRTANSQIVTIGYAHPEKLIEVTG